MAPDAARIDHHLRIERQFTFGVVVVCLHAHDARAVTQQLRHFGIGPYLGAVSLGVDYVRRGQAEGVDRTVGYAHSAYQRGVGRRLQTTRIVGIEHLGSDAGLTARLDETRLIVETVLGKRDEESVGLLDTVRGDLAQRHVLADTLHGRLVVRHGIPRTAVQQSVVTARGARRYVGTFEQQHLEAAQRAVARGTGTRSAAADDDYIIRVVHIAG